jgi:hypothetical protein
MIWMKLRLAGGVVTSGRCAWVSRPSGPAPLADQSDAPAGAAVALGPADATGEQVGLAVAELDRLVTAGGVVAAGAGVDLGGGFRSARLEGAPGDQRDAVLAALKVLGVEGADRLGDRAGFLVALFGPSVTKRVGAATAQAIAESRWAAVHLASAASDVLGPEQLERVLALRAPDGADLVSGGLPSALAARLKQVFEPIPRQRRLELLVDLWARVSEHHAGLARRARLLASQARQSRVDELRARRAHHEDERTLAQLRYHLGNREPTLADAARWEAPEDYWYGVLNRLLQDALAATALLRTAVAVSDHGMADGLTRAKPLLAAAAAQLPEWAAAHAARAVPGLAGLPARPVSYVRDIHRRLAKDRPFDARLAGYVRPRLARARDYALLTSEKIRELLDYALQPPDEVLHGWAGTKLTGWRRRAGYTSVRPPTAWAELPPWIRRSLGLSETLADRLAARPDEDAAEVEVIGDLLWYAELIDALAQLYGHDAAKLTGDGVYRLEYDPPAAVEPLTPRLDSITLAVSGAAQLVELGAKPAKGLKTWAALVEDLRGDIDIAAALSGEFSIPAPLAAVDGMIIPGTSTRFRLARSARTLAEWSDYMGNCIASPYYIDSATKGRCGLAALYDKDDRLLANVELRPARPAERGWQVVEVAGRFNESPDVALDKRFRRWLTTLPAVKPTAAAPPDEAWPDRPRRRRPRPRLLEDAGPALGRLAEQAWADLVTDDVIGPLAVLAGTAPDAALTQLRRRLRAGPLTNACRDALGAGAVDLVDLWTATGVRPLATAVEALDPALRDRFERLDLLLGDNPLPGSMRKLVRLPAIAPAYSLDLVARRIRAAIGLLAYDDDPTVAAAVTRRTTRPLLCALVVAITCRAPEINLSRVSPPREVTVPGFPATRLDDKDGPWQRAFPAARELGADTTPFWDQIAEHGLRAPASWLPAGGWTALWAKSR